MLQILQATMSDQDQILRFFHYIPSKALAIVGLAVYALFAIYLSIRVYRSKSSKFLYILPITALAECIGYLIRAMCSESVSMGKYIGMTMFLLLSPNALALVNYKAVGEVVRLSNVQTDRFYLRPKFVTWFFFSSDIFSFWLQGSGGGLQQMEKAKNIGVAITLIGLAVQLIFFACFVLITMHVHRNPEYNYYIEGQPNAKRNLMICMYVTLGLLYIRSIYRLAEYATGYGGPVASAEWAFYIFDGLAIALCFVAYSVLFIGDYLPKPDDILNGGNTTATKIPSFAASSTDRLNPGANDIEMQANRNTKSYANNKF